jgi:ankyrin repeat protein
LSEELNLLLDDAINRDDFDEVVDLINRGADLEWRDSFGCTPLMNAAWIASAKIVNYLIEIGAKVNCMDSEGFTALERIKTIGHNEYGHDAVISILINAMKSDR